LTISQRLPDRNLRETGEWATAEYIFAMKVLNLDTQAQLSKRVGDIAYLEKTHTKQWSQGSEKGESFGSHPRTHAAIPPEMFGRLKHRRCILFHDEGVAPCKTILNEMEQSEIQVPGYVERRDIIEFMKKLD
jgi:hypothetical protein